MEETIIKIELQENGKVRCQIKGASVNLINMLGSAMASDPHLSDLMVAAALGIEMKRIREEEEILRQAKNN